MTERGIVKWYSVARGYGFITHGRTQEEIFVHYSAIQEQDRPLVDGESVRFEIEQSPKGPRGRNVVRDEPGHESS